MNRYKNQDFGLNNIDIITTLYILITAVILFAVAGVDDGSLSHYLIRAFMLIFIGAISYLSKSRNGKFVEFIHLIYPLAFLSYFFPETDYIGQFISTDHDNLLIGLEQLVFTTLPSEIFSVCCPWTWLNELMHLAYFSFYLIITFFVVYYHYKFPEKAGKRIFTFFLSFYLFYLFFIFFPSSGPQYFITSQGENIQNGYFFTALMGKILEYGDRPTGAFPSSHIGMTWLVMYFFFKDNRKLFFMWLVPAALLTLSTVYIRAHYAIDVLAGLTIVPLLLWAGRYTYSRLFEMGSIVKLKSTTKNVSKSPTVK